MTFATLNMVVIKWTELCRRSRRFLWFLVKKSAAAAAVRYREVEKEVFQNDLCHPYSCCVVLNYLDAAFPKSRLDFLSPSFSSRFFHKCRQKIYLQFVFLIAGVFRDQPCSAQQTDYDMQVYAVAVLKQVLISHMGIGTGPGMVYGQALEFFFLKGSLQRTWQETRLNF